MLAVITPACVPATPAGPVKTVTAFPLPSVIGAAGSTLVPPVWTKVTVTPLTAVPKLFFTVAVMTLLPPVIGRVEGAGGVVPKVMLNADVDDPVLVIATALVAVPTAA